MLNDLIMIDYACHAKPINDGVAQHYRDSSECVFKNSSTKRLKALLAGLSLFSLYVILKLAFVLLRY